MATLKMTSACSPTLGLAGLIDQDHLAGVIFSAKAGMAINASKRKAIYFNFMYVSKCKIKIKKKQGKHRDICLIIPCFHFSIRRKKRIFDLSNCNPEPIRFLWHLLSLHNEIKRFLT